MDEKARAEEDNGKKIKPHVLEWQNDVIEIQESAKTLAVKYENRLSWRCIQCLPIPNPVSRFRLGREAVQKAKSITEFTDSGEKFLASEIASFPPVENVPISDTAFQIFQSREGAYGKLWKQLVTEGSSLILGIYGIPGVGKTRMMEQIWKEAKEKGIFDKVTVAVPGNENLNDNQVIINIQNQIAGYLGCHFESQDNVERRASQLKNSLINGGKTLVILDDVWSEIPLNKIGIPFVDGSSSNGCKILFTSREEDVCLRNNCKHPVRITTLTVDEAWNLFRNTVGTSQIDSLQDQSLARRVCNKCANLPPLIHAVGKALRFKSQNSLEDELFRFHNCDIRDIQGFVPKVYAYLPPVENLPKNDTAFQNFESRKEAHGNLWEALVTEGSSLIHGIYGMPGVGKTRMMEQIWKEAHEKGTFDKVTRAVLGNENLNDNQVIINVQNQIAGNLDCEFESQDNVDRRASQLKSNLMNGDKILVILDDVWSVIPLDKIGITFGDGSSFKGCKILLTSRKKDVCLDNNCEHPVMITTLTADEAWNLFRNTVGTHHIDDMHDESLAVEVCNKCGGLPLVIHAVGKSLKFKHHDSWKDALYQLNNCGIESIAGIDPEVYVCLKWSFDRLVDEDAKTCLLLCSLFPEDAEISNTVLFQLATGSQLVKRCQRSRVRTMVHILKSASLLLDGYNDEHFKLHDIIRDVTRSIAINDPTYAFLIVKCRSPLLDNDDYGTRKLLHLDLDRNDVRFPNDQVCPDLQTLWLQCNKNIQKFSGGFFRMFANLSFLFLRFMIISSEQFSLKPLGKLRTIILDGCDITGIGETDVGGIGETDISFFPENVQTLCIWDCVLPTSLDLPNLKYLRKLEILGPLREVIMVPTAISSLSSLEELHIPNGFIIFNDNRSALILDEISKLTCLRSLQITLSNNEPFQDIIYTFSNLLEFNIHVGCLQSSQVHGASSVPVTRLIELSEYHFEGAESLVERAEEVILVDSNVKVSSICNRNKEAFADLRYLCIEDCHTMEHLARISHDEIQHSHQPRTSFSKLICLQIKDCSAIKYLFCNSVAKCLDQLEELYVESCPLMEVIVMNDGISDGDIINFSKLKTLKLKHLPRLTSFYGEKKEMHFSSTSIMDNSGISSVQFQPLFDGKVAFPSLKKLDIWYLEGTSDIWGNQYDNDNVSFCQMKSLKIRGCHKLEIVFQLGMLHRLRNLKDLEIWDCYSLRKVFLPSTAIDLMHLKIMTVYSCDTMTEIIGAGEQEGTSDGDIINFSKLKTLKLSYLPRLTSFYRGKKDMHSGPTSIMDIPYVQFQPLFDEKVAFPSLENLEIGNLDGTSDIWGNHYDNDNVSFCRMKSLIVLSCNKLEIVFQLGMLHRLRNLEYLLICRCNSLRNVFLPSTARDLMHLKDMIVRNCEMMSEIIAAGEQEIGDDIVFTELTVLKLTELPSLTSFIADTYKVVFPNLVWFEVLDCVEINLEGLELGRDDSTCPLKEISINCDNDIQLPCQWQPRLYNLEKMVLTHAWWHEQKSPRFQRLKVLNVSKSDCSTLFTFSAFSCLQQLEELRISYCPLLEEIVESDIRGEEPSGMDKKTITLSQLKSVTLQDLPNLKSFVHSANYECHMPALKEVKVDNCGLSILFTCSVFRNLQQLKSLDVTNCILLEGIVEDGRGAETSDKKNIALFQLKTVYLKNLPNLKSFSSTTSYAFNLPNYNCIRLTRCARVESFCFYDASTEKITDMNDCIKPKSMN